MIAANNHDAMTAHKSVAKPANVLNTMANTATMMNQNISGFLRRSGRISSFTSWVARGVVTRPLPFFWRAIVMGTQALTTIDFATLSAGT